VTGTGISGGRKLSANMEKDLRRFPDQPHAKHDGGVGGTIVRLQ
jgi:hypothetical protein